MQGFIAPREIVQNLIQNLSKLFVHGNNWLKDRSAFFPRFALKAPPFGMSSGRFRSLSEKEHEHFFYKHELSLIEHEFFINYFCPQICTDLTEDWKKHLKPRLWGLRSIDLTCCPSVLCLKASFCTARKYITVFAKTQPSQRQKHKKGSAHGRIGTTHFASFPASLCARLCRFRNEMEKESAAHSP